MALKVLQSSRIKTPWESLTNLHLLWDAAGGLYLDEWPRVPPVPRLVMACGRIFRGELTVRCGEALFVDRFPETMGFPTSMLVYGRIPSSYG